MTAIDNITHPSTLLRIAKTVLAVLVVIVIGYFYAGEFKKNAVDLNIVNLELNISFLILALFLGLVSYLADVFIWKLIIDVHHGPEKITWPEIGAMLYASGVFRYLPGRVWKYAVQFAWLKKYGISKTLIIYINSVCMIELIITSLYFGLMYLAMYDNGPSVAVIILLSAVLLFANVLFNLFNSLVINRIFALAGKISKTDIQAIHVPATVMFGIQAVFTAGWLLTGLAVYLLAMGFGLTVIPSNMIPVLASLSLSWVAGCLAVITPAGLGVRDGMMMLLLKPVLVMQTALLLPILSRVLFMLSEALLGVMALFLGIRHKVFSIKNM